MQPENRVLRFALVAIPVMLLLTVVAVASQAGFGTSGNAAPNNEYVSYAMSVFFVLFVLMIPVAIYSYFMRLHDVSNQRATPGRRVVKTLVAVALVGVVLYVRHLIHADFSLKNISFFGHHGGPPTAGAGHGKHGAAATPQPHFEYSVLWAAIGIGVVLLVAWFYARAHRPPVEQSSLPPTMEEDVVATIDDAIDDLEREPDPRRAVIAAYARMERVLGRHGLERRKSETAIEYLRRVLLGLSSSGAAVERLTSLFEAAKFSGHDITAPMKSDAIASLREIREGIET